MSYVRRRRFLCLLFPIGIFLVAIVANATTLGDSRFINWFRIPRPSPGYAALTPHSHAEWRNLNRHSV